MGGFGRFAGAALVAVASCLALSPTAHADHTITLTFVRHAQSAGNASGVIDTSVPGPDITGQGEQQAVHAANELSPNDYDGIYASTMVRTQETAAPMSEALGEPVTVLAGVREIEAGVYEGRPEAEAQQFFSAPTARLNGDRNARIPDRSTATNSMLVSTMPSSPSTTAAIFVPSRSRTRPRSCSGCS